MTGNEYSPTRRRFAAMAGTALTGGLLAASASATQPAQAAPQGSDCDAVDTGPLTKPGSAEVEAQVAALDRLSYWEGSWKGRGWTSTENGVMKYDQYERIERKLSGELLVVEGKGTTRNKPAEVLFRAFATLRYDTETDTYLWRAMSAGSEVEVPFEVTDDGWAWELPLGGPAKMRYESSFRGSRWHETGEFTPDGGSTWVPSLDMTVIRERRCDVP